MNMTHITNKYDDLTPYDDLVEQPIYLVRRTIEIPKNQYMLIKSIRIVQDPEDENKFSYIIKIDLDDNEYYITKSMFQAIYKRNVNVMQYFGKEDIHDQFSKHKIKVYKSAKNNMPEIITDDE